MRWVPSIVIGAVIGAAIALLVGMAAVALAPDDGFADLAAAAVTRVFLVPVGAIAGAVVGGVGASRASRAR